MTIPFLFQEKMLAGLDRQIRLAVGPPGSGTDDPLLISMCVAPWEIPGLFNLATGDPTLVIDRYGLKAVCFGNYYASHAPDNNDWAVDIDNPISVPLFLPGDVWKALHRHNEGDPGFEPPPVTCGIDKVLRNIRRGYESLSPESLSLTAHDLEVLAGALTTANADGASGTINDLISRGSLWKVTEYLDDKAGSEYRASYSKTALYSLRQILELERLGRDNCMATWVSPAIIPFIESCKAFREAVQRPRWLLYKAVTVFKGHLPETEHNRMVGEAMADDGYSTAYFEFLKSTAAFSEYADSGPIRVLFAKLARASP